MSENVSIQRFIDRVIESPRALFLVALQFQASRSPARRYIGSVGRSLSRGEIDAFLHQHQFKQFALLRAKSLDVLSQIFHGESGCQACCSASGAAASATELFTKRRSPLSAGRITQKRLKPAGARRTRKT